MKIFVKVLTAILLFAPAAMAQVPEESAPTPAWSQPWGPQPLTGGAAPPAATVRKPVLPNAKTTPSVLPPHRTENQNPLSTTVTVGPVNLGPGDLLDIALFDLPDLSTQVRVTSDGEITFPLLGKLQVLGMTPLQVQDLIRARLVSGDFVKDPQVAVFVSEYANQSVYVLGEVNKPGAYPLLGAHRLYDFISAASGFTLLAGKSITITRIADPLTPETVHFSRDPDFAGGNPQIAAGDTVYVGKAGVIYVVGEVNKAGGFLMVSAESMTVMEALATAEGAKPTAALGSVRLIRKTDQGRTETTLNVNQIFQLHGPDMVLHDQDILYVPRSAARVGVQTFLTYGVGAALGAAIYRF